MVKYATQLYNLAMHRKFTSKFIGTIRQEGRCLSCGKPVEKYKRCPECIKYISKKKQKLINRRKDEGVCIRCGGPLGARSKLLCEEHLKRQLEIVRRSQERKKSQA